MRAAVLAEVDGRMDLLPQEPEARPQDRLVRAGGRVGPGVFEQVAGEVLGQEAVVGDVGVEGTDDVVAVPPGVRDVGVVLVAARLGVARGPAVDFQREVP